MGKGILYIMMSRVIWILSGFAIHVGLGRFLGPKLYGVFGIILSLSGFLLLIYNSGLFLLYFLTLLLIKEINKEDISFIRNIFARYNLKKSHLNDPS